MKTKQVNKYILVPIPINKRLLTLWVPLSFDKDLTPISLYVSTLDSDDDVKFSFYEHLDRTIQAVPNHDKLLILGDFNPRVGRDYQLWSGVLGREDTGKCNAN